MTSNQDARRGNQARANRMQLSVALCALALVAALALGSSRSVLPRASADGPRLHTALSIGSDALQVNLNITVN